MLLHQLANGHTPFLGSSLWLVGGAAWLAIKRKRRQPCDTRHCFSLHCLTGSSLALHWLTGSSLALHWLFTGSLGPRDSISCFVSRNWDWLCASCSTYSDLEILFILTELPFFNPIIEDEEHVLLDKLSPGLKSAVHAKDVITMPCSSAPTQHELPLATCLGAITNDFQKRKVAKSTSSHRKLYHWEHQKQHEL